MSENKLILQSANLLYSRYSSLLLRNHINQVLNNASEGNVLGVLHEKGLRR
jgi:hypothetical protein